MANTIEIKTGELAVGHNDDVIKTGSVGSCVVISIFDKVNKIGGLAHSMLPERRGHSEEETGFDLKPGNSSAKYVDEAVDNLITAVSITGGKKENLEAKLIGGASMFQHLTGEKLGIGRQNTEMAKKRLDFHSIPLANEDTGGNAGKIVTMDLRTGIVETKTAI